MLCKFILTKFPKLKQKVTPELIVYIFIEFQVIQKNRHKFRYTIISMIFLLSIREVLLLLELRNLDIRDSLIAILGYLLLNNLSNSYSIIINSSL